MHTIVVEGYCLMPNHFHLLVKPEICGSDISKMMQFAMTKFGVYINKKYNLVGRAFQGTYKHRRISDLEDLKNVKEYFRNNPIEAKMVSKPEYYKWLKV
jgi:putative transposase